MKDSLSFVLVLLIATTTLNRGEKIDELKIKDFNNKRKWDVRILPGPGQTQGFKPFTRADSGFLIFPRPGRSYSSDYDVVLGFNPEDISEVKRQGLIPYPRVGRSHEVASPFYGNEIVKLGKIKRTGDAVSNGAMWFGPRLGRLHRRANEQQNADDQQWPVFPLRDFPGPAAVLQSENFGSSRLARIESDQDDAGQSTSNTGVY